VRTAGDCFKIVRTLSFLITIYLGIWAIRHQIFFKHIPCVRHYNRNTTVNKTAWDPPKIEFV
jgi:hypothetical protein